MPDVSFTYLVMSFFGCFGFVVACAWFLIRADQQTMLLFKKRKFWGLTKHDDETELKKTKKEVVFIYAVPLIFFMAGTLYLGFQIWTRL